MNRTESKEILNQIIYLYLVEKLSLQAVGKQVGIEKQAVHERLIRAGIETRPREPKKTLSKKELIRLNTEEMLTIPQIAAKLNVSSYLVSSEMKRHQIKVKIWNQKFKKFPQFSTLQIGETTIIKNEGWKNPYSNLYQFAKNQGIRISIKRVDDQHFRITRKG